MNKSDLIRRLGDKFPDLKSIDVDQAVSLLLDLLGSTLASGGRMEVRGFGSFSLNRRNARMGRNPKTGAIVAIPGHAIPHFKPGKELRGRVNQSRENFPIGDDNSS